MSIKVKPDGDFVFTGDIEKDPSDVIDLVIDYAPFFKTDTIGTITVTGTNITVDSSSVASNVVTVWVSAGTDGVDGEVKLNVVTSTRTLERTLVIKVLNK